MEDPGQEGTQEFTPALAMSAKGKRDLLVALVVVAILAAIIVPQYFPRYQEGAQGVRDHWTGEFCRYSALSPDLAVCPEGRSLFRRSGGGWR